ncbi:MAG: hypothetical protein R3D00_18035 [Bacteroidia bacterium]
MPYVKLIFPLFFFFPLIVQAQVEIFLASGSSSFLPEGAFAFRLQNHHPASQRVYVTARLKTSREILFLQSAPVLLAPGGRTFLPGEIPVVHMEGVESLPAGVYTFCLSVIQEDNGQELGTQCVSRRYETTPISPTASANKKKQPVAFSGQARLTARISNQPDLFTGIPPRYIRFQASPRVSVWGIHPPVTLHDAATGIDKNTGRCQGKFTRGYLLNP